MPTFLVTSPEGKKYKVNAPDGATQEQAIQYVQGGGVAPEDSFSNRLSQSTKERRKEEDRIISDIVEGKKGEAVGLGEYALSQVGGTVGDVIGAATQPLVKKFVEDWPEFVKEPARQATAFVGQQYEKLPQNTKDIISAGGNALNLTGAGFATKPVARQAIKVAKEVPDVATSIGKSVSKAKDAALSSIVPDITPEISELADIAKNKFNLPVTVSDVAPRSIVGGYASQGKDEIFSGAKNQAENLVERWNQEVVKTFNSKNFNVKDLSPKSIKSFKSQIDNNYKKAIGDGDYPIDIEEFNKIKEIADSTEGLIDENSKQVWSGLKKFLNEVNVKKVTNNVKDGTDPFSGQPIFRTVVSDSNPTISASKLNQLRRSLFNDISNMDDLSASKVRDVIRVIDETVIKNTTPEQQKLFKETNGVYRNFKTMEKLLEKSTTGKIQPSDLLDKIANSKFMSAAETSNVEDSFIALARIGKQFIKKPPTVLDRGIQIGISGAKAALPIFVGATVNPLLGAALFATEKGANRAVQSLNKSNKLLQLSIEKGKK